MTTEASERGFRWHTLLRRLHWAALAILGLFIMFTSMVRFYPASYPYPTLPRVTHTGSGANGDPLNVMIVGSKAQITTAFSRAGWLVPDPITPQTSARIAADSIAHRAYPSAPVSNLYVFGRRQDLAFERPTNDVQNRGHIRLWQTALRMAGQPVWIGAATYDHGIELNGRTGLPTHHIVPAVDLERDAVGAHLSHTGLVVAEVYDLFTPPVFVAYNGGGDYYASDGQVLTVSFTHTSLPAPTGFTRFYAALARGLFRVYDAILTMAPLALTAAIAMIALLALALWPLLNWLRRKHRGLCRLIQ